MKNGEMQENIVRKYTYQMLKGCEYLHKNKVIHRDIKGICIQFHFFNNLYSSNLLYCYIIYILHEYRAGKRFSHSQNYYYYKKYREAKVSSHGKFNWGVEVAREQDENKHEWRSRKLWLSVALLNSLTMCPQFVGSVKLLLIMC